MMPMQNMPQNGMVMCQQQPQMMQPQMMCQQQPQMMMPQQQPAQTVVVNCPQQQPQMMCQQPMMMQQQPQIMVQQPQMMMQQQPMMMQQPMQCNTSNTCTTTTTTTTVQQPQMMANTMMIPSPMMGPAMIPMAPSPVMTCVSTGVPGLPMGAVCMPANGGAKRDSVTHVVIGGNSKQHPQQRRSSVKSQGRNSQGRRSDPNSPCTRCHGRGFTHESKMPHDTSRNMRCFFCKECPTCHGCSSGKRQSCGNQGNQTCHTGKGQKGVKVVLH